jgi:hypothetical protein
MGRQGIAKIANKRQSAKNARKANKRQNQENSTIEIEGGTRDSEINGFL